jgi:hypothetical protein
MSEHRTASELAQNGDSGRVRGRPFVRGGVNPNPGGRPKKVRAYERAIQRQETPGLVASVVAALRQQALEGGKGAAACAKVYFQAVGLPLREPDDSSRVQEGVQRELQRLVAQAEAEIEAERRRAEQDAEGPALLPPGAIQSTFRCLPKCSM